MQNENLLLVILFIITLMAPSGCTKNQEPVERPPKIVSLRNKWFDKEKYEQLADAWHKYYEAYPSEDAYGNWMYATRYAHNPEFIPLLRKGLKKYPYNPTLLYLSGGHKHDYQEPGYGIEEMELSAKIDPDYTDPWFALSTAYLAIGDNSEYENALRKLLEMKAIPDEVIDYNYNMIALLDTNAILLTNGDNDTYPGEILTKVVNYRPDVIIANRALIETEWYCENVIQQGVPRFIDEGQFKQIRDVRIAELKATDPISFQTGLIADTLCIRLIEAAEKAGRSVYIASTFRPPTPAFAKIIEEGLNLGIVILLTKPKHEPEKIVNKAFDTYMNDFRTGGLDSWQLRYSPLDNTSRRLMRNYFAGLGMMIDKSPGGRELDTELAFQWIEAHCAPLMSKELHKQMVQIFDTWKSESK